MPKFEVVSEYTPSGDQPEAIKACLLNTSDAAYDSYCVYLGGRRIKKKIF